MTQRSLIPKDIYTVTNNIDYENKTRFGFKTENYMRKQKEREKRLVEEEEERQRKRTHFLKHHK